MDANLEKNLFSVDESNSLSQSLDTFDFSVAELSFRNLKVTPDEEDIENLSNNSKK